MQLQTWSRDLVVVPNSELAKGNFKNFSRPSRLHRETFEIGFSYDDPPNGVKQILKQVALETEGVLAEPEPWVYITTYADFFIGYQVGLYAADYETSGGIRNEFATRLWYAARRHGLTIPYPTHTQYHYESVAPIREDKSMQVTEVLRSIPSLSMIAPVLVEQLRDRIVTHGYGKNELVIAEGERLPGLYIILKGHAKVSVRDQIGNKQGSSVHSLSLLMGTC